MKSETFTTTVLNAEEGHFLTQSAEVEITERIVATSVALGRYSTPEDWKEIDKEEADAIIAEQNEARKAEIEAMRETPTTE